MWGIKRGPDSLQCWVPSALQSRGPRSGNGSTPERTLATGVVLPLKAGGGGAVLSGTKMWIVQSSMASFR